MRARDARTLIAIVCFIGFGALSNIFQEFGGDKWQTLAMMAASLAAVYIGLDLLIATETSLFYRISKSVVSVEYHQMGALMIVIVFSVFALLTLAKLIGVFS
ncbi:MAG TPA: hypothetical protein VMP08_05800 [Anaerolineae bacterium]|nr:hypothetical protein [Anaerolineae bacterium]